MLTYRSQLLSVALVLGVALDARPAGDEPSLITLKVSDAPARQVFAELAKQVGATIPSTPPDLFESPAIPKLSIDAQRQPFWVIAKQLGEQSGIAPVLPGDDPYPRMQWGLASAFWEGPHVVAGPLVLFVHQVARSVTVELGSKEHEVDRELTVSLLAFVEPGLRVVSVGPGVQVSEAMDENGKRLTWPPVEVVDEPGTRAWAWNPVFQLKYPEGTGTRIARLKGVMNLRVATAVQPVEFVDVMRSRDVTRPLRGATLTFRNMIKADIDYVLRVRLRREKMPPEQWELLWHSLYNGMLALYDEKGRLIADRCTENGREFAEDKFEATLRFVREPGVSHPQAGEPHKLIWEAPTAVKDLAVEFEFRDLPIPQ